MSRHEIAAILARSATGLSRPSVGSLGDAIAALWQEHHYEVYFLDMSFREFIDFHLLGRHRLESISLLPLGDSIATAIALYGQPVESSPTEETSDIIDYRFVASPYHEVLACEWNGTIQSIVYCSARGDPARDLAYVLTHYKGSSAWSVMERGYWYQRKDGMVRLWCSAVPVIGVACVKFLEAQAAYKQAHSVDQLENLPDATWAPDEAICELQRRFVQDGNSQLVEFARRSPKIALSPDGKNLFIVRDHYAYDVGDGFQELNAPPEPGNGYSTQVINCFTWGSVGSNWSKITLPRDAYVERIFFQAGNCHLDIRQKTTGRILSFAGRPETIAALSVISFSAKPHSDNELWRHLTEAADATRG